jgi:hypothetical protein
MEREHKIVVRHLEIEGGDCKGEGPTNIWKLRPGGKYTQGSK